ncbi:MAG: Transcription_WhiD, partial [uncultured Frankineae bacterium]
DRHLPPPRSPVGPVGVAAARGLPRQGHRSVLPPGGRAGTSSGQPGGGRQGCLCNVSGDAAVPGARPGLPGAVRRLGWAVGARARGGPRPGRARHLGRRRLL